MRSEMITLTDTQKHIDKIKSLMWKQVEEHPLGAPQYYCSLNYGYAFDGGKLSNDEFFRRWDINQVKSTHSFINKLIRKTFGEDIAIWWFIHNHTDDVDDNGNVIKGRFHSHMIMSGISDDAIENPSPYLMPLFYKEDECGIPINCRPLEIDNMKPLLLDACIRQSKWIGRKPQALKVDYVLPQEMETVFHYCARHFNSSLEQMDIHIDWENSSYYKP